MGDTVLAHSGVPRRPGVDVLFVDTGYHFAETLGHGDAVRFGYPVRVRTIAPAESRDDHERVRGQLHRTDPDRCCALRKVRPLDNALRGYRAWATDSAGTSHRPGPAPRP
jgi:phosphoadenosine phosphosulfate reductase